jgi:hypothetical protein
MQMSPVKLFVFVEGKQNDPYFYGKLCDTVCKPRSVNYLLIKAEMYSTSGGKGSVLKYFHYLRTINSLVDNFQGKRTLSIFFVDKDLDGISAQKIH